MSSSKQALLRSRLVGRIESFQLVTPPLVTQGVAQLGTVSVPGANVGDLVIIATGTDMLGLFVQGYVSGPSVVTWNLANPTATPQTLPPSTWTFIVEQYKRS
jgi:hypothetical protein